MLQKPAPEIVAIGLNVHWREKLAPASKLWRRFLERVLRALVYRSASGLGIPVSRVSREIPWELELT